MSEFDEIPGGLSMVEQRDLTFAQMKAQATAALRRGSRRVMVNPADLIGALATLEALQEREAAMLARVTRRAREKALRGASDELLEIRDSLRGDNHPAASGRRLGYEGAARHLRSMADQAAEVGPRP